MALDRLVALVNQLAPQNSESPPALQRTARCPRCGYDLRGAVEAWTDSCPVTGQCAECGLRFEWGDLLNIKRKRPRWCVEYARSFRALILRSVATLALTVWPPLFWGSLQMWHEPRWRRVGVYIASLFVLVYATFAVGHGALAWREWRLHKQGFGVVQWSRTPVLSRSVQQGPYTTTASPLTTVAQAVFLPWSDQSPGAMAPSPSGVTWAAYRDIHLQVERLPDGTYPPLPATFPHPSPRELFLRGYESPTRGTWGRRWEQPGLPGPVGMTMLICGFPALVASLCPAFFRLLPQTRRKAKVHWRHIIRVALYSAPFVIAPLLCAILGNVYRHWAGWSHDILFGRLAWIAFLLTPLVLVVWWWAAARRYLKMPHAFGVAVCAVATSFLVVMLCGYFVLVSRLAVLLG